MVTRVPPMRLLHSPRLQLEPQLQAHAQEMFGVLSDPALYRFENQPPASLDWLQERFARLESRLSGDGSEWWLNWVLRLKPLPTEHAGALIGFVQASLHIGADGRPQAWVAYVLASAHWRQGLATEALAAMLDELAGPYGVQRALAVFKRNNLRSAWLLQRLGFAVPAQSQLPPGLALEGDEDLLVRSLPG